MDLGTIFGILGIVIGLLTSLLFYKKGLKIKEPHYAIHSNNLLQGSKYSLSGLSFLYQGKSIDNLTVSKLIFWNRGAETLDRLDIETINPLKITFLGEAKLLNLMILQTNNSSMNLAFDINEDQKSALIKFDYLDQKDGFLVQLIHTGISSDNILIEGDIKGVKKITRSQIPSKFRITKFPSGFQVSNLETSIWILLGIGLLYLISAGIFYYENPGSPIFWISLLGGLLIAAGGIQKLITNPRFPNNLGFPEDKEFP